jgi:outer membrane protein TolC
MFDYIQNSTYMKLLAKTITIFPVLVVAVILSSGSNAQEKKPLYKPAPPGSAADSLHIIQERLVALALKSPRYEVSDHQNMINMYQLKRAKSTLLNLIALSTTINGQTFTKASSPTTPTVVYPKLTAGISIPLGTIFSRTEVKAAREQIEMGKNTQELLARAIRKEVLSKYLQYRAANEQIVNLTHLVDDESATAGQIDQQFKDGKITLEQYGLVSKAASTNSNELVQLQLQRDTYKLEIEEMIGVLLEDVLSGKIRPEINNP